MNKRMCWLTVALLFAVLAVTAWLGMRHLTKEPEQRGQPLENSEATDPSSALAESQPEKTVTDAEKKEFLKLLATLPHRGEFFAKEAIPKAAPYTRVLLALTEKDLEKFDLYPFFALSAGLMEDKEARQYATANFGKIAHPQIKLGWGIMLFRQGTAPPEVVPYLRKALDSEPERNFGLGPGFQDFKDEVIGAHEAGKSMSVGLVKQHTIQAFPEFGGGLDYSNRDHIFAPSGVIYAVRPERKQQRGELITYDIAKGKASSRLIPQPAGFKPQYAFTSYFDGASLAVNTDGDLLCFWMIKATAIMALPYFGRGQPTFSSIASPRISWVAASCPHPTAAGTSSRMKAGSSLSIASIRT